MKLSESTVTFLKNYATINQSLEFREGDTLKTVSPLNTILASVKITENFPRNFPIRNTCPWPELALNPPWGHHG